MALLKPGPIGTPSGAVAGAEFALSKGRVILKRRKSRQSSWSPLRANAQAAQTAAIRYWQSMTADQITAWNRAAETIMVPDRFGTPRAQTGFSLWMSLPHDFRYIAMPAWTAYPPLKNARPGTLGTVTITAPNVFDIACVWPTTGFARWVYAHYARFRTSTANPKTYRALALHLLGGSPTHASFQDQLDDENEEFLVGEQVRVIAHYFSENDTTPGMRWPISHDFGLVTVGAP